MTRLQTEIERLYGAPPASEDEPVRALVLELARPAEWAPMARLWQGVQADLGWPAPAIAVNGVDGYQLWFSLAQPLPPAQAQGLLEQLCQRYLADLPPDRLRLRPGLGIGLPRQVGDDTWSAFVSSDLAAVFADTPWLDLPPGDEAQAELLARLSCTPAPDVVRVLAATPPRPVTASGPAPTVAPTASAAAPLAETQEVRQFLLGVMRDPDADLRLRVEAAKALLG